MLILAHSCSMANLRWSTVSYCLPFWKTRAVRIPQRSSIGFRSRLNAGHCNTGILRSLKEFFVTCRLKNYPADMSSYGHKYCQQILSTHCPKDLYTFIWVDIKHIGVHSIEAECSPYYQDTAQIGIYLQTVKCYNVLSKSFGLDTKAVCLIILFSCLIWTILFLVISSRNLVSILPLLIESTTASRRIVYIDQCWFSVRYVALYHN